MSWSYDSKLGSNKDKVRFLIADTNSNKQVMDDEAINEFLSMAGGDVFTAAANCADGLASRYAGSANIRIDGFQVNRLATVQHYKELAIRLRAQAGTSSGSLGQPVVGGISESIMDGVDSDSDRVQPQASRHAWDNERNW